MSWANRILVVMAREPDMSLQWDSKYFTANGTILYDDLHQLMLNMYGGLSGPRSEMEEHREKLLYYLMGIGGSIVCCMGTIANAVSIAVLTRRSMRSSTYTYLAALAVCDSLVLFLTLLIIINDTQHPDSPQQIDQFHAILFPFVHPSAVVFQVTSIWLTLAFTVDRYIMICHPFKAERMCRRSRARKVIICIYIMGLAFNIPRFLEYTTTFDTLPVTPNSSQVITVYGIRTTPLGNSVLFRELIHSWLYLLFICGIPFLTLVVLNAFLIRAVHLSRLKGKEINPREKHRNDTTIMLIGVIVIFLICQGPALVSRMIYAFKPASESTTAGFTLNEVGNFLVLLNSAINIVPYYLFGRKFRLEFLRIFCSCTLDKDDVRRMSRNYSVSLDHRRLSQYNAIEMNGVAKNSCNNQSTVASRDTSNSSQPNTDTGPDLIPNETSNGKTNSFRHSDSMDNVAAPLIHQACSMYSNKIASRGASKESLKNISSHCLASPDTFCPQRTLIFTVGSIQRRYVSRHHAKVWLVEVPAPKTSDATAATAEAPVARRETIVYQCRLWRHFSGRLNWEGLQTILQRIMTFLMANPGYSLQKLCHMLNPDILPATTVEAMDILEEIGCVEMRRLQNPAQCSLFSSRKRGLAMGDKVRAEDCITVIDVLIEAPIKLAYFLDLAVQYCQRT